MHYEPKNHLFHYLLWYSTGLSYTQTGAVCIERTENIVEQSDWLLESKVYC